MENMTNMAQCKKILHEATAAVYKSGADKPSTRWSFFFKYDSDDQETFSDVITRLKTTTGIKERADEVGIFGFKIKLNIRRNEAEPEFPKGRVFAIDTEEQFKQMMPLLQNNYELIGMKIQQFITSRYNCTIWTHNVIYEPFI